MSTTPEQAEQVEEQDNAEQGDSEQAHAEQDGVHQDAAEVQAVADPDSGVRYWWLPAGQVAHAWRDAMKAEPEAEPAPHVLTGFLTALLEPILDMTARHIWQQARHAVEHDFAEARDRLESADPLREERPPVAIDVDLTVFDSVQELMRLVAKDTWQSASTVIADHGDGPAHRLEQATVVMPTGTALDALIHQQAKDGQHD